MKPVKFLALTMAFLLIFCLIYTPAAFGAKASEGDENDAFLVINKKTNKMAYFSNGYLERIFDVATGRTPSLTPEGIFPIVNKIKNRPYYTDNIPGGDPRNPLGDRWLGLHVGKTYGTTYAIHGNNNEDSIGKYVSKGCVRMHNDDIHWLYDQLPLFTEVLITTSDQPFEELAAGAGYPVRVVFSGKLYVNGEEVTLEQPMIEYRGRMYLPLRAVFELLGGSVQWDAATRTVTSVVGERTIVHSADSNTVHMNGVAVTLSDASYLRDGTLMMPLRGIAESLGWSVEWDGASQSVHLAEE